MKKCNEEDLSVFRESGWHNRRGPSSFNMQDSDLIFKKMNLKKGDTFVDLGCGAGEYSLYASNIVGAKGKVFAVDISIEMLNDLKKIAANRNINNLEVIESDICTAIHIKDHCTDCCLLATVMHAQKLTDRCKNLFPEIARILKPGAQLAIIECKKENFFFGPPVSMRISPKELEKGVLPYGFVKTDYFDLEHNYMMMFVRK